MHNDRKLKCSSCGEMFVSETNATLCPSCARDVANMGD